MLQEYQNEISPIIYYGISTKINEKDLKIPILQPPDWKSPYWMSLYVEVNRGHNMLHQVAQTFMNTGGERWFINPKESKL